VHQLENKVLDIKTEFTSPIMTSHHNKFDSTICGAIFLRNYNQV